MKPMKFLFEHVFHRSSCSACSSWVVTYPRWGINLGSRCNLWASFLIPKSQPPDTMALKMRCLRTEACSDHELEFREVLHYCQIWQPLKFWGFALVKSSVSLTWILLLCRGKRKLKEIYYWNKGRKLNSASCHKRVMDKEHTDNDYF